MDSEDKDPFRSYFLNIISASRFRPFLALFIIVFAFSVSLAHAESIYYSIQIGAYKSQKYADQESNRLTELGYDTFILPRKSQANHVWYRVYLERFSSKIEAEQQAQKAKQAGLIQDYLIKRLKGEFQSKPHQESGSQRRNDLPTVTSKPRSNPNIEEGRAYYDIGVFAFEDGDYTEAEENLKFALEYNPNHPFYNHYMGKIHLKQKRYEEAWKHLQYAWDRNPDIPELKYDIAFLNYKVANYSQAADLFSEVSEEAPSNVLAQYYTGICLYKRERYEQAVDYFLSAAEKSPGIKANSYYYAGLCYLKSGDTEKAIETLAYVRDSAESELLRNNASNWLRAIEKHRKSRRPYSLYAKLGFGYDSNVPLDPIDQDFFADDDDFFGLGYFSGKYDFVRKARYRIGAGYSHYQRMYLELDDFDLIGSIFDFYGIYLFNPFTFKLGYVPTYYWLGSDSWLRRHQIIPELTWRINPNLFSSLAYRFSQNTFFQDSDRNGQTHDVFANAYYQLGDKRTTLFGGAGYEINNADTPDQDWGLFRARLGGSFQLPWKLKSSITLRVIDKRFDNEDSFYGETRHDFKYGGYVNLYRDLYSDWLGIDLQYDYIKSDSNIDDFDYDRSVFTLSLKGRF